MAESPFHFHSPQNLAKLEEAVQAADLQVGDMPLFADHLVKHAHPLGEALFERWHRAISTQADNADIAMAMSKFTQMRAAYDYVRKYVKLEELSADFRQDCYRPDNMMLFRKDGSKNLLVVWSTMYNNFGISTAALVAMLRTLDCHLLVLKDAGSSYFMNGIKGFAGSFGEIAPNIEKLAGQLGAENINFLAYSSGGFSALLVSLILPCRSYLCFSQRAYLQDDERYAQYRRSLSKHLGINEDAFVRMVTINRPENDPAVKRSLYVGAANSRDVKQSQLVAETLPSTLVSLPDVGHNTIPLMLARGDFLDIVESHVLAASGRLN